MHSAITDFIVSPRYVNECDMPGFGNKFTVKLAFHMASLEDVSRMVCAHKAMLHEQRSVTQQHSLHDEFFFTDDLSVIAGARLEQIGNRWRKYVGLVVSRDRLSDYELGLVYRPIKLKTYVEKFSVPPPSRSAIIRLYIQDGTFLERKQGLQHDVVLKLGVS